MASEAESFIENLFNSRNRGISLFLPFILAISNSSNSTTQVQDSTNPNQQTQESTTQFENLERIILVNPITQGMVIIENQSILSDYLSKQGQPPASKSSIEGLPRVEGKGECVICLEEYEICKEMPCKHKFHENCIEKWLKMHGTCPICRYKMPEEEEEENDLNNKSENSGRRRREIWTSFSLGNDWRSDENSQTENEHDHGSLD